MVEGSNSFPEYFNIEFLERERDFAKTTCWSQQRSKLSGITLRQKGSQPTQYVGQISTGAAARVDNVEICSVETCATEISRTASMVPQAANAVGASHWFGHASKRDSVSDGR